MLFGLKKYLPINIITFDIYDNYSSNTSLIPINTPINMIKISDKIPIIKQQNIYNRYHNIYSYTNDYELYLDDFKLLNVDETGTLKTTGNIKTNNIYLNGDIYNREGVSLYDNKNLPLIFFTASKTSCGVIMFSVYPHCFLRRE